MQSKNPTNPVVRLPTRKVVPSTFPKSPLLAIFISTVASPERMAIGKSIKTPPALLHHAREIALLLTTGNELLMKTAWRAIKTLERTP